MANALRFRQWKTPKQAGERARLKIVHGPDLGSIFVVTDEKFTMGRGDENDVIFADLRASRRHAEVTRMATGLWKVKDLGSQNGVVWNGTITREADLSAGDILTVGETAFEFVTAESGDRFLHTPSKKVPPGYLIGSAPAKHSLAVAAPRPAPAPAPSASFSGIQGLSGIAGINASLGNQASGGNSGEKRKKIIIGIVVLMGLWTYIDETRPKAKPKTAATVKAEQKKKEREAAERDLASYLPPMSAGSPFSSAGSFFKEGFREFREKNYLRARIQFETAIQINPAHALSRSYLQQAEQAIETEVESHIERGRRDLDAGKLRSARAHFEAVQRLLSRDPQNPSFIEAKDQLRAVDIRSRKGMDNS